MRVPPRSAVSEYRVEGDQELAHARHQGHLFGLAGGQEPPVELPYLGVAAAGDRRPHVKRLPDPPPAAPHAATRPLNKVPAESRFGGATPTRAQSRSGGRAPGSGSSARRVLFWGWGGAQPRRSGRGGPRRRADRSWRACRGGAGEVAGPCGVDHADGEPRRGECRCDRALEAAASFEENEGGARLFEAAEELFEALLLVGDYEGLPRLGRRATSRRALERSMPPTKGLLTGASDFSLLSHRPASACPTLRVRARRGLRPRQPFGLHRGFSQGARRAGLSYGFQRAKETSVCRAHTVRS